MKISLNLFFLFVFITKTSVWTQPLTMNVLSDKNNNYWDDFKLTTSTVFSTEQYEPWQIYGYAGLAALFYLSTDLELHEEYGLEKENKPMGLPRFMGKIGNIYDRPGPLYFAISLTGLTYFSAKILNDRKLLQTTGMMVKSLLVTSLFTVVLKGMIGRARPHVKNDPHLFKPFNYKFDANYMSMPSGHTSTVFALMTIIAKQYDTWYIKIPAYTFASSVAVQRMNNKKHWISDLLIGATLGYLVADTIVKLDSSVDQKLSVRPVIDGHGFGLSIYF